MTRVTSVVSEGSPVFPHAGRFASMIERHNVTIFKAGVTFLKSVMSDPSNLAELQRYDMGALRVATFCAEPTSPSVQAFGMQHVVPQYINSYWATEHGGIAWTHFYGNRDFPLKPDAHAYPLPWIVGDVWWRMPKRTAVTRPMRARVMAGCRGVGPKWARKARSLSLRPIPIWRGRSGAMSTISRRKRQRRQQLARRFRALGRWLLEALARTWAYTQGDFAIAHDDGSFSLHGRSDDVINVSGHRMGTEEIEGAVLRDKALDPDSPVGNVLVVGAPHREKGLTPLAFIVPVAGRS